MLKVYLELTKEQEDRGVVFSSCLSTEQIEQPGDRIHEVTNDMDEDKKDLKISRLLDDKFFNDSPWKYNIIRR